MKTPAKSAPKGEVRCKLAHDIQGAFMVWPKGTAVIATPRNRARSIYSIRRDPPFGHTTINNVMSCVPSYCLAIPQSPASEGRSKSKGREKK